MGILKDRLLADLRWVSLGPPPQALELSWRKERGEVKVVQKAIAWWRFGLGALALCTLNSLGVGLRTWSLYLHILFEPHFNPGRLV